MSVAAVKIIDEFGWSEGDKGLLLSSFYWGYATGQLPASYIAARVGAKWTFGFSILVPSILSIITPWAVRESLALALFIRALLGLATAGCFPSCYHFYPEWVPLDEKTIMITIVGSGMYLGEIVSFSISGWLA
jgi:MFS family permease